LFSYFVNTNPRDAFRGQSRSSNMVPFDRLVWFSISILFCP